MTHDFTDTIAWDKARFTDILRICSCKWNYYRNDSTVGSPLQTAAQVVYCTTSRCVIQRESDIEGLPRVEQCTACATTGTQIK